MSLPLLTSVSILEYSLDELKSLLVKNAFKPYRAKQFFHFAYNKCTRDFKEMPLPKDLISFFSDNYSMLSLEEISCKISSKKDTYKYAFMLKKDGSRIESVIIKEGARNTLCISSQVGCPLACVFCATGKMGFLRNLSVDEILSQFIYLKAKHSRIDNIVFMGMGEPLINYSNLRKAILILFDKEGSALGARRITISTAGIPRGIRKLAGDILLNKVNLAVSLNSMDSRVRGKLMPFSKKIGLSELISSIKYYYSKTKRWPTLEYVMLDGINIAKDDAKKIIELYDKEFKFDLNLIPYNAITFPSLGESEHYRRPSLPSIKYFTNFFKYSKIRVVERKRKGRDIKAACGQLIQDL